MNVGEVFVVFADVLDDVPFHYLHMVNIIQQLEVGRADTTAQLDAPNRMIALVILMPYAIEKLHRQHDIVLLCQRHQALQALRTVFPSLQVGQAVAASGETDQIGQSSFGHHRNHFLVAGNQFVMQLRIVETAVDA